MPATGAQSSSFNLNFGELVVVLASSRLPLLSAAPR
jgi:hypothetical protein